MSKSIVGYMHLIGDFRRPIDRFAGFCRKIGLIKVVDFCEIVMLKKTITGSVRNIPIGRRLIAKGPKILLDFIHDKSMINRDEEYIGRWTFYIDKASNDYPETDMVVLVEYVPGEPA